MNIFLIAIGTTIFLTLILKIWNKYSRQYNHNILLNSKCQNCKATLGSHALEKAISSMDEEKKQMKLDTKIGTVKFLNMKIICSSCGTINLERDLYRSNRKNKNV